MPCALVERGQDKVKALHEAVLGRHAGAVHALTTFKINVNKATVVRAVLLGLFAYRRSPYAVP